MKRAIFIGLIAAAPLCACSSDGMANGGGRGAMGAIGSYQTPPSNPQEALLNPELPLPNSSAPLPNDQAPLPNPQQPAPPGGPGSRLQNVCDSVCNVGGVCSGACQDRCAALGTVVGPCAGPIAAFIQCAGNVGLRLLCDDNGRLVVPDGTGCLNQGRAAAECLGFNVQTSDTSGPGNGRGRRNDAGLPLP